ncbi:MAG TPA: hypothetical protein DCO75_07580 [Fibrobacteres bacterium]|jgi:hypothetical protein|nr:hypothetical protein [Fibrobacterota bacterium]
MIKIYYDVDMMGTCHTLCEKTNRKNKNRYYTSVTRIYIGSGACKSCFNYNGDGIDDGGSFIICILAELDKKEG